ncbi:DUF3467 domain-containing protein [bacterium]|nr:DUF3467 domain-containing protein [bacterium]
MNQIKDEQKINVSITDDIAAGKYSNNVMIHVGKTEFVLDFGVFQPQLKQNRVQSRVILHPDTAKALLQTLHKTIVVYEQSQNSTEKNDREILQ